MSSIGVESPLLPLWFLKTCLLEREREKEREREREREREKEREKSCFFVTFNIIISHISPVNLIDISQVVQKI